MIDDLIKNWKRKLFELEGKVRKLKFELEKKQNTELIWPLTTEELEEDISYLKDWIGFYSKEIERYEAKLKKIQSNEIISDVQETQKNIQDSFKFIFKDYKENQKTINEKISNTKENAVKIFKTQPLFVKYAIPCIILLLIISSLFLYKPAVTGHVVLSKEATFTQNLNLRINESGTYEWKVINPSDIRYIKATGNVLGNGTVKVYIEKDGKRYLLYKNK